VANEEFSVPKLLDPAGERIFPDQQCLLIPTRGLVSKETVVLRRWGRETQILDLSTKFIR